MKTNYTILVALQVLALLALDAPCGQIRAAQDAALPPSGSSATNSSQEISMTISTNKFVYDPDDPIYLFITIRNESKDRIPYPYTNWSNPDRLTVLYNSVVEPHEPGQLTRPTDLSVQDLHHELYGVNVSGMLTEIPPIEQGRACFILNRARDMSRSGYYRVTVTDKEETLGTSPKLVSLKSNTIELTIKPMERLPLGVQSFESIPLSQAFK